jgi:MoaA/NifB/PqqE/SkfB family radical SAM enzyme
VFNRFKVINEYSKKKDELVSFPNMIHIEPTNHCNLGCIMCPQPREMQRVKGMMNFDLYKSIIDELKDTPAEFVYLHQFGESLLHKKITDMVDYASENGLQVGMSTNGTLLNEKISERILNSKLDFLTLSLDGATEESYDKIRPGVGF